MVKQGDVLKIGFNPQRGHEQAGFRPAVVISNRLLNDRLTLAFLCPVTHTKRNNPFHYELTGYDFVDGFVMCDQLKTMDLQARRYDIIGHLRDEDTKNIIERVEMLIEKE
ncbi:MAG: type II toxin-antitoxin system PemK/MazF family toxin [Lachnospiraceae bacterium]|nr:type II toxin-antitoxin system PemK/MazF family toxin [Lachnospiraceae bacterium]